jgi:NAD(P)-dependent dehydrogenase (short-subunit alcohol dehydrogenase family)
MVSHDRNSSSVALVTGGGTGVGLAIATALAEAGWQVVITGRRGQILDNAAARLVSKGLAVTGIVADLADPAAVKNLFAEVVSGHGRLDLLVNNAGINAPPLPLEEVDFSDWNAVVASNLTSAFLCTQHAVRLFKTQSPKGGRIINNGSVSATTPRPNSAPYAATKHAITGLTKATSLEGRAHNIACGQIDIGNAASEMTDTISKGVLQADGSIRAEATIDPRDVADAVVYMAGLPLGTNVLTLTVMANAMPFVGRG